MLVVDGADDVHVPQHDTLVFRGRPLATIAGWLEHTLAAISAGAVR